MKLSYYLFCIILYLGFFQLVLELLGVPPFISILFQNILIVLLLVISLLNIVKKKSIKHPGGGVIILFIIGIIFSALLNRSSILLFLFFFKQFFIYILLFYGLLNIDFNQKYKDKLFKLLMFLFLIQIPASWIKLYLEGIRENYIGTMSNESGSLSTIVPLIALSYIITWFYSKRQLKYIFYALLFIGFSISGAKLATIYYFVFLFFSLMALYSFKISYINNIGYNYLTKSIKISFLVIILGILFIKLTPRANPEHKVWGSFDIEYLYKFTQMYNRIQIATEQGTISQGRWHSYDLSYSRLHEKGVMHILFGDGPGKLVESSFLKREEVLLKEYKIGYGGRIGFVWIFLQLGIFGIFFFLAFHIYLFYKILKLYRSRKGIYNINMILPIIGLYLIFFIDFFTYSGLFLYNNLIPIIFYFLIYQTLSMKNDTKDYNLIKITN